MLKSGVRNQKANLNESIVTLSFGFRALALCEVVSVRTYPKNPRHGRDEKKYLCSSVCICGFKSLKTNFSDRLLARLYPKLSCKLRGSVGISSRYTRLFLLSSIWAILKKSEVLLDIASSLCVRGLSKWIKSSLEPIRKVGSVRFGTTDEHR
jgi:hypothetical protein